MAGMSSRRPGCDCRPARVQLALTIHTRISLICHRRCIIANSKSIEIEHLHDSHPRRTPFLSVTDNIESSSLFLKNTVITLTVSCLVLCGNKMPTRCNRLFLYCRSHCLLNMVRAQLCPSSGAQEYYTAPDDGHNGARNMLSKQ